MQQTISQEIIDHYSKYVRKKEYIETKISDQITFEVDAKYEIVGQSNEIIQNRSFQNLVGQGSYGVVVAALDKTLTAKRKLVAIKKIENAFELKTYTKRTLRELRLQRILKHENIIGIEEILLPRSREEFSSIYLVSELMETDLYSLIRQDHPLTEDHCQFFIYQLLRGLKFIHSANVVHRDLKPRNILINKNCDLKICDFGLARVMEQNVSVQLISVLTGYVVTRWYRAPELLFAWREYTKAGNTLVDMWSVGCILGEMLLRRALFPGASNKHQLELIFQLIGSPPEQELAAIPSQKGRNLARSLVRYPGKVFSKVSAGAIDLLKKMLTFNPSKRITAEEALLHPYLSKLHFPDDEPIAVPAPRIEFQFEDYNLTLEQLKGRQIAPYYSRDCIYEEILLYHFEDFKKEYMMKRKQGQSLISHILMNSNSQLVRESEKYFKVDSEEEKEEQSE